MDPYIILQNLRLMKGEVEYVKDYLSRLDTKLDSLITQLDSEEIIRWNEQKDSQTKNTPKSGSET